MLYLYYIISLFKASISIYEILILLHQEYNCFASFMLIYRVTIILNYVQLYMNAPRID